jgi:threonine/homoserine/homoserine lactone efflux protein
MDLLPYLLHIAAIHLLMAMVPGPNTVVVSFCSAGIARTAGLKAALGVAAASFIWASLSLAGIGVLLAHAGDFFRLIRLLGAGYLIYVGIRMLRARAGSEADARPPVYRSPFWAGFLTTLSNPKSAVFWTSVFALVVPAHAPAWFYGAILAVVTLQSFLWYGTVAMALSSPFSRKHYARLTTVLNRVAGSCMVFFGLKIANDVRAEIAARVV